MAEITTRNYLKYDLTGETGDSNVINFQAFELNQYALCQVEITGTCTIIVQGRVDSDFGWIDLYTFTADGAQQVSKFPQMRFSVTTLAGSDSVIAGLVG